MASELAATRTQRYAAPGGRKEMEEAGVDQFIFMAGRGRDHSPTSKWCDLDRSHRQRP